jgi:pimeloyl-ACP methyl ester carboxylesterase
MSAASGSGPDRQRLFADLDRAVADLGIGAERAGEPELAGRRRRLARRGAELTMNVVEHAGVLYVDGDLPPPLGAGRRRRGPRAFGLRDEVIKPVPLAQLEPSKVGAALAALDEKCNPNQGLRQLAVHDAGGKVSATLAPAGALDGLKKALLLVHGTFSNTENWLRQFDRAPNGAAFYRFLAKGYDRVLAFDHPTLAVSPMLNAHRLAGDLAPLAGASIDVVCHSRGGLVARWWLEAFDRGPADRRRAVFVGSPLAGTGLAAPQNLRGSLSLLLNLGTMAADFAAVIPFGAIVSQLFRVFASVASLAVASPALDAALAMVPGLAAQSRVSNNFELLDQRRRAVSDRYFAVRSNFETERSGWAFWKAFRNFKDRAFNAAADTVFDGPNDLVVDTASMTNFHDASPTMPAKRVLDYRTSATVHHTNYFEQERTLAQIVDWLK